MNYDEDIKRIKSRISIINSCFNHGYIKLLIDTFISYMVTLEITNKNEILTIQEILTEIKNRIKKLNNLFSEMLWAIEFIDSNDKLNIEKETFKFNVRKLFDISDITDILINKCVTFGYNINTILPYVKSYMKIVSDNLIDSIFYIDSESEFIQKLYDYITDRYSSIENPITRKLTKINTLDNLIKRISKEPLNISLDAPLEDKFNYKELKMEKMIEMTNILHKKY